MAAGQQKKRLSSSNLHEQYKGKKKKKLDTLDSMLTLRPNIYLEWDDRKKQTLSKKEQIGITWTDMAPFLDYVPKRRSGLADVVSVPQEVFGLEDLKDVLSFEAWEECLSDSEREFLLQFLPSGTDAEETVHSLLNGENHHFGNPLLKWSSSLCSDDLHPDKVRHMDRQFRANKKEYYSEINQYHIEMIEVLKKWKEKWASCRDPEKLRRGLTKVKRERLPISYEKAKVAANSKKEVPHKICVRSDDTAKYMSYIKISKKQFELVKNLKHSGDGIQSKSLDRVIGDISSFNIHPYDGFEEEEKNRLHEHWLLVVKKDLPAAFHERRGRTLRKEEWGKLLELELVEKKKQIMDKMEIESLDSSPDRQYEDEESISHHRDMIHKDIVDSPYNSFHGQHTSCIPSLNARIENIVNLDQEAVGQDIQKPAAKVSIVGQDIQQPAAKVSIIGQDIQSPAAKVSIIVQDIQQPAAKVSIIGQDIQKPAAKVSIISQISGEKSSSEDDMEPRAPVSPSYPWQDGTMQDSNYLPNSESHQLSFGELSLRQPQAADERPPHVINFERDILEHEAGASIASALHMDSTEPIFYPYARQNQDVLLPPFPKESGILTSYPHEHMNGLKQPELGLLMANESLSHSDHLSHQFQEHQQLIDQRRSREQEIFMHQVMHKNLYPNGRYPQGQMSAEPHGLVALQPSMNGGLAGHNWYPQQNRAHGGWSGIESNGASLGDGGVVDGSLFSVLSGCGNLPSGTPYGNPTSEHYMQARNFVSGGIPNNDAIYGYTSRQVKSSNGHNVASNPADLNMPWMNYPHPNSSMRPTNNKPFLGPWKQ